MVLQILQHRHYSLALSANILKIILLSLLIKIPPFPEFYQNSRRDLVFSYEQQL